MISLPVNIGPRARSLEHILATEGEWRELYIHGTATVTVANTAATVGIVQGPTATPSGGSAIFGMPYIGRCYYVESVTISASQTGVYNIGMLGDITARHTPWNRRLILTANQPVVIPVRQIWQHRRAEPANGAAPSLVLASRQCIPALAADASVTASITVSGWALTDDLNWYADRTLLVVGDSLSHGDGWGPTTGAPNYYPTSSQDMWTHKVRDYLRTQQARDWRLLSIAQPGLTTSNVAVESLRGRYDGLPRDMLLYALGTNDAILAAGGFVDTYESNVRAFWARHAAVYPRCPMVLLTPGPMNDSTNESNAALLRTRADAIVASVGSQYLKHVSLASAFTRTDTSKFRTATDLIHWSASGHADIATACNAGLTAAGLA